MALTERQRFVFPCYVINLDIVSQQGNLSKYWSNVTASSRLSLKQLFLAVEKLFFVALSLSALLLVGMHF